MKVLSFLPHLCVVFDEIGQLAVKIVLRINKLNLHWAVAVLIYIWMFMSTVWVGYAWADTVNQSTPLVDYSQPRSDLSAEQLLNFAVGRSLFKKLWVAAPASTRSSDGLGPLYNARSCFMCHRNAGRGRVSDQGETAVSLLMRLSIPAETVEQQQCLDDLRCKVIAEPRYGSQLQNFAVTGLAAEGKLEIVYSDVPMQLSDNETVILRQPHYQINQLQYGNLHPKTLLSPRLAPQLVGLDWLDRIAVADIMAYHDPDDRNQDGISGKVNRVWSREFLRVMLGRFGYKAGVVSLNEQNQAALFHDLGLSTVLFPEAWGDCTVSQMQCRNALHGNKQIQNNISEKKLKSETVLEASQKVSDAIAFYIRNLALPLPRNRHQPQFIAGKKLFQQLKCHLCHRENYQVDNQSIAPYSDLLLHDMGDALADNRPEGLASGQEWRTAPLWGIGLTQHVNGNHFYLHDGRARSLQEAILWHGGEALTARKGYMKLSKTERDMLLVFLESL